MIIITLERNKLQKKIYVQDKNATGNRDSDNNNTCRCVDYKLRYCTYNIKNFSENLRAEIINSIPEKSRHPNMELETHGQIPWV